MSPHSGPAPLPSTPPPMPVEGDPAPPLALTAPDGNPVTLSAFKGRPVVVFFIPKAATPG